MYDCDSYTTKHLTDASENIPVNDVRLEHSQTLSAFHHAQLHTFGPGLYHCKTKERKIDMSN